MCYYRVLGVSRNSTKAAIRKAYLDKAKTCHPDVNKAPSAEKAFKEVQEAYSVLSDDTKRREFDLSLGMHGPGSSSSSSSSSGAHHGSHHGPWSASQQHWEGPGRAHPNSFQAEYMRMRQQQEEELRRAFERARQTGSAPYGFYSTNGNADPEEKEREWQKSYQRAATISTWLRILPLVLLPALVVWMISRNYNQAKTQPTHQFGVPVYYDHSGHAFLIDGVGRRYRAPEFDKGFEQHKANPYR